jgi:hypothetical protein
MGNPVCLWRWYHPVLIFDMTSAGVTAFIQSYWISYHLINDACICIGALLPACITYARVDTFGKLLVKNIETTLHV